MKRRNFLYFLIYPVFGPLVGYILIVAGFVIFLFANNSYAEAVLQLKKDVWDIFVTIGFAYILGGVQATATGIYAARALAKNGKSRLIAALTVATFACVFIVSVIALAEGVASLRLIVFILPPALISTIVIHSLERYFRIPDVQAKS